LSVYVDTSALVKLYAEEADREIVFQAVNSSEMVATSTVAYAEARAALARRLRERALNEEEHRRAVERLGRDWPTYERLSVSNLVAYRAGELAQKHALRDFDAVHLASAARLREKFEDLHFMAFDDRLLDAAREAALPVYGDQIRAQEG
jgi:predicted nucleic acid-binding protein